MKKIAIARDLNKNTQCIFSRTDIVARSARGNEILKNIVNMTFGKTSVIISYNL